MNVPGWVAPPWQSSTEPPGHEELRGWVPPGSVTNTRLGTQAVPASHESGPGRAVKVAWACCPEATVTDE